MQAVRVTDVKVLDAPMELVKGDVKAPSGVTGTGSLFAINHNADNALITLRYKLKDADIQVAEEPFESGGHEVQPRDVRHQGRVAGGSRQGDQRARAEGARARGRAVGEDAPGARRADRDPALVDEHADRRLVAAGVRHLSGSRTTTSIRRRFATRPNLRAKYDVIIFGPGGNQGAVEGTPLWQTPIPYQNTADTPNIGTWAQTDDTRIGMGLEGLMHLRKFIDAGGAFIASNSSADFAITNNFTYGVTANRPATTTRVVGSLLRTKLVDETSPIVYGVPDNLAIYSDAGETFSVSATAGGGGRGGGGGGGGGAAGGGRGGGAGGRPTGRGTPDDPDVVQGRAVGRRHEPDAACRTPSAGAALAVRDADRGGAEAESGERDSAEVPPARAAALRRAEHAARVGAARRRRRHRAAAGRRGRAGRQGTRRALRRPTRSTAARRSAATSWCSTRS